MPRLTLMTIDPDVEGATRIQFRRDTTAEWASINPVLFQGEVGIDTDRDKLKVGDGITPWNDLKFSSQRKMIKRMKKTASKYTRRPIWFDAI